MMSSKFIDKQRQRIEEMKDRFADRGTRLDSTDKEHYWVYGFTGSG
ncbi:unnamed protein product, partial [marine sediment metagenome]